jgi:predicted ATPase
VELFLAVLGATGVVMAIAANATSIAKYVGERRRSAPPKTARADRERRTGDRVEGATHAAPVVDASPPPRAPALPIRTPDQRVRVFVSSTLAELAPERAAARAAIEALRLTPVLFELGARPHPPRDLYRAYLAQSDVFVGIYGERYGWVAPGEEVSGLEDEYRLAADHPKLVYVRAPTAAREPALERLLERIRRDDRASYKPFRSAEELGGLIGDDLAVLLSERFALAAASSAEPRDPTPVPAAAPPAAPEAALPPQPTSFVGRDALMSELVEVLLRPEVRLLTLYGPGGAGKSRVAIELATRVGERLGDEVRYVSLAAVRDPLLVASSLAIGLGVQEEVGRTTVAALQQALAGRSGLLLIDNFEHLVEAAPVVADLVAGAPAWTVLVTSRSVLRLRGEVVYPIPPLDLPDVVGATAPDELLGFGAVRLFVDRARAVDPHFELDADHAAAVEEICRRVDALPLAIELAAARVRSLPPTALLARMTRRLPLLSGGPRDAPERQRTLRDAIAWSVALLDPGERTLFERLSVFDGCASTEAIERVLGAEGDVLEGVTSLVDKSLLQRVDPGAGERVRMLETVREYAAEALDRDPEAGELRLRHARAYLELAEQGARALKGSEQTRWQRLLQDDLGNLRAAMTALLTAAAIGEALRLATALRPLFMARCHYEEGARLLRAALEPGATAVDARAAGADDGAVRAAALLALGALTWRQGDLEASRGPIEESLATYRALGDLAGAAAALRLYGVHAHNSGHYDVARGRFEEALELMRRLGDREGVANTLLGLGNVAFDRGEAVATVHYEESRAISEADGDTLGVAYALDNLGALAWCRSDLAAADVHTDAVAALYAQLDHPLGHANVAHRRGLLAIARASYGDAERHLRASLAIRESIGEVRGAAFVRHDLGRVALARGDLDGAEREFLAGLDLAERHGAPLILVLYLEGLAALCAEREAPDDALELLAAALAWRRAERVPLCAVTRPRHEALVRRLRAAVEPSAWRTIEATGTSRTVVEAVARARACLERRPRAPAG